jgi:tetratricopeptide (TPR) repeat protein
MMHLAVREDDLVRAESLATRAGKDFADTTMFAVARGDSALLNRVRAEARGAVPLGWVAAAVWQTGSWLWDPAAAEPMARIAAARPENPRRGNMLLAENQVAQGRWLAADSAYLAAAQGWTNPDARVSRAIAAALPFLAVPRAELEQMRTELAGWDPARSGGDAAGITAPWRPQLRLYALGLLSARLGDADGALRSAAQLEASVTAPDNAAVTRSLGAAVRADVALSAHRPADALKALDVVRGEVPLDLLNATPFGEDYARYLRAEALLATGRTDEARRWFENGFFGTPDELWFLPSASLRLGEIYERNGERQKAIDSYARFVRLWKRCDARLRPAVDDARARLARLTAEPGA